MLRKVFPEKLAISNGDVHQAITDTINEIHEVIKEHKEWNAVGSTLVMSFIDNNTNIIYTATVGDSEANIYRWIDGEIKSIPLSCYAIGIAKARLRDTLRLAILQF